MRFSVLTLIAIAMFPAASFAASERELKCRADYIQDPVKGEWARVWLSKNSNTEFSFQGDGLELRAITDSTESTTEFSMRDLHNAGVEKRFKDSFHSKGYTEFHFDSRDENLPVFRIVVISCSRFFEGILEK